MTRASHPAYPRLKTFFTYFGAKFRSACRYPAPVYDTIIEPFAGAAGYSILYHNRKIILNEVDPILYGIWDYLIHVKESEILSLPVIEFGTQVSDYNICQEAKWLIGFHVNPGVSSPCNTQTVWAIERPNNQWMNDVKKKIIASQLKYIRHWKVKLGSYVDLDNEEATWFIDPPYQGPGSRYRFSSKYINFDQLATWCLERQGQSIVCEQDGADWLPFCSLGEVRSKLGFSSEVICHTDNSQATDRVALND